MKIIQRKNIIVTEKPEGTKVWYYLFDEYELHYNEQPPKTTQTWHHHDKIHETLLILEGELIAEWKVNGLVKKQLVKQGDLIETENTPHSFTNDTDKPVKFIVIKQILTGKDKKDILKNDKVID